METKVGTLDEFMQWTRQVVRTPGGAGDAPRRWVSHAVASRGDNPGDVPGEAVSAEAMVKLLSPANLRLIQAIAQNKPGSVRELADMTARKEASVSRTLHKLAAAGIVRMEKSEGRRLRPTLAATGVRLDIDFRFGSHTGVRLRDGQAA